MEPENRIEILDPGPRAIDRRRANKLAAIEIEPDESPSLLAYWIVLRKRHWTVLALLAFTFAAVLIATLKETPLYEAKALIEIEKENPNIVTTADLFEIHNHFAGLLEMILPLTLALGFYYWRKSRDRMRRHSLGDFFLRVGDAEMSKCYLLLLAAAMLSLALVFSFSRMGLISMLASFGMMAAAATVGKNRRQMPAALILFLIVGGVATVAWVGVEPVVKHFEELSHDDPLAQRNEGRMALWKDTMKLVREHPWAGAGLGSFQFAFTRVQSRELNYTVEHAHNDYLEFAAEMGVPAAAFLFVSFLLVALRTLQASRRAKSSRTRALALGTLGGTSALLIHGFADFNLHIPANALLFSVLLGMGYATSMELNAAERAIAPTRHAAAGPLQHRRVDDSANVEPSETVEEVEAVKGLRSS